MISWISEIVELPSHQIQTSNMEKQENSFKTTQKYEWPLHFHPGRRFPAYRIIQLRFKLVTRTNWELQYNHLKIFEPCYHRDAKWNTCFHRYDAKTHLEPDLDSICATIFLVSTSLFHLFHLLHSADVESYWVLTLWAWQLWQLLQKNYESLVYTSISSIETWFSW